jgi:hypothetical protein
MDPKSRLNERQSTAKHGKARQLLRERENVIKRLRELDANQMASYIQPLCAPFFAQVL